MAAVVGWTDDLRLATAALAEAVQATGLDSAPPTPLRPSGPSPIIKAQALPPEGEPAAEERLGPEGRPLTYSERLNLNEYKSAYKELKAIDSGNPVLGPFL